MMFRKDGCHCPVCRRDTLINDSASYGRKEKQSVENAGGTSEEPRSSATQATPGSSKRKEAPEPTIQRSARNTSGGKRGGFKGTKGSTTYEEEELKYVPDWDVCTTDNPSDPLVAQNLAEGLVLPFKAAEIAEMPTDFLIQGTYVHCVTALNFISTSLRRAAEMNETEEFLKDKICEKDTCMTELKEQLQSAEARAATAESRVKEIGVAAALEWAKVINNLKKEIAQKDASISMLRKELKSVQANAIYSC